MRCNSASLSASKPPRTESSISGVIGTRCRSAPLRTARAGDVAAAEGGAENAEELLERRPPLRPRHKLAAGFRGRRAGGPTGRPPMPAPSRGLEYRRARVPSAGRPGGRDAVQVLKRRRGLGRSSRHSAPPRRKPRVGDGGDPLGRQLPEEVPDLIERDLAVSIAQQPNHLQPGQHAPAHKRLSARSPRGPGKRSRSI